MADDPIDAEQPIDTEQIEQLLRDVPSADVPPKTPPVTVEDMEALLDRATQAIKSEQTEQVATESHEVSPHKAPPHKAPPHKAPPHKAPPHKAPPSDASRRSSATAVPPSTSSLSANQSATYDFKDLVDSATLNERSTLDLLQDVEFDLRIELGRTELPLEDVLQLQQGSVVALDKLAGDPVEVFVNGRLVARGEVLVMNDNFCVRVSELVAGDQ